MILAAIFLSVLAVSNAHICLISPAQRGSMLGLNTEGSNDCFLTTAPCGGRHRVPRTGEGFGPGENVTVTFQKNLDHYNASSPGYFTINFGSDEGQMQEMARIPDKGEKSLHLYSMNVTMPRNVQSAAGHIIQVVYHPNNSDAPANFYQCADILVGKPPGPPGRR